MEQEYKSIKGELKLCEKSNKYLSNVELWLLNGKDNRNNWRYTELEKHLEDFAGKPILIAYVNGGRTIGDGHNFKEMRDPSTGEEYASFTDSDAERICGALSDNVADIELRKDAEGVDWVVAKGTLWNWYCREAVQKIRHDTKLGRGMSISIETLVTESHMDGDIEVMDEYTILGVTILGDGVAPAVESAKIMALQEVGEHFKELKLKAASYQGNQSEDDEDDDDEEEKNPEGESDDSNDGDDDSSDDESDDDEGDAKETDEGEGQMVEFSTSENKNKETTKAMAFKKKELAELQPKFEGYTVLAAEVVNDELHVGLMGKDCSFYKYCGAASEQTILPERIQRVNVNASIEFNSECKLDVDVEDVIDNPASQVITLSADLEKCQQELNEAKSTIDAMKKAENSRRLEAARAMAKDALNKFNANREDKVDASAIENICKDVEDGAYTDKCDNEGAWCGDKDVEKDVLAECAKAVMAMDAQKSSEKRSMNAWDAFVGNKESHENGSVESLLNQWGIE